MCPGGILPPESLHRRKLVHKNIGMRAERGFRVLFLGEVIEHVLERCERHARRHLCPAQKKCSVGTALVLHRHEHPDSAGRMARGEHERHGGVAERELLAVGDVHVALHDGPVWALPCDDGVPVGCAHQDSRLVRVLNVEAAACVVVVPVADDQIFDLGRVEPHLFQSTHQHVATLVGVVKRIEDDDAVARWNGPRADVAETEVVQVLEHANRLEQPIRFGRKARRLSRQRWALRSRRCAERLCVGDEIVSRNLHCSRDVLLRLLGRRELLRRRKLIALRAASATAAALAALRLHQARRARRNNESDQHVLRHDGPLSERSPQVAHHIR